MSDLSYDVLEKIFSYLPIPTDEIFGRGDGGKRKWNKLKNLLFSIMRAPPSHEEIFDQFESNEYLKIIKTHHSVKSLVEQYHQPPFFPDNLRLEIDESYVNEFYKYGLAEKFSLELRGEFRYITEYRDLDDPVYFEPVYVPEGEFDWGEIIGKDSSSELGIQGG